MVDAPSSPGVAPDPDALTDKLAGVMAVNSLSAESMLADFFTDDTMGAHLAAAYGKSGKGNPATLAARLVAQWKPRTRVTRARAAAARRNGRTRMITPGERRRRRRAGWRRMCSEEGRRRRGREKTKVGKRDDDDDEREKTRAPPPLSSPPPPKKRFHHDRA